MAKTPSDAELQGAMHALEQRIAALEALLRDRDAALSGLRESQKHVELAMIGADIGTWDWDVPAGSVSYNERWAEMLGYALEEITPQASTWEALVHPDDLPRVQAALQAHFEGRTEAYETEHRIRHKTGRWVWVLDKGCVLEWDAEHKPRRICGTHLDITERKLAEEKLHHLHGLMRYIIEHTRSAIAVHDRDMKYVWVSQRYLDEYGVKERDGIGQHHYDVFPDLPQKWRDVHQRALAGEVSSADDDPYAREDGRVDWTRWECRPRYAADGSIGGLIVYTEVVTERKRAEMERARLQEQLLQAQKMESVGRLAGGVAHDFNNMLNVILGHAELALKKIDSGHPLQRHVVEIQKAALRSADLTRQLLAFSRQQTVSPKVLDLNEVVGGMMTMLQRLIGEDIELVWNPGPDLWAIKMDPVQIDQILVNLCVNSRDAIVGVGKVAIETRNGSFDADYCASHAGFMPGDYVSLAVRDDGCGMTKEIQAHLFEPFYTTKPTGKGTGLGLATAYGIVKQNQGFIVVDSEPGQGTTVTIHLARHRGGADPKWAPGPLVEAAGGRETVLLVEDEPAVLDLGRLMLEALGYRVLTAQSPKEAAGIAHQHAGEVHLLMTDVVMPEMNGRELAEKLTTIYPNLRCLFTSGYTANVIAHRGVLDEGVQVIQKPFSMKDLAAKVREALASR